MAYCIIDGRLVAAEEAVVSISDRGFRYGDGVFEVIAVWEGVPYQFDWHMARLDSGLKAIKIPFAVNSRREHCRRLLKENALRDGLLRLQVTRGSGSRGYLPDTAAHPLFVIETMAPAPHPPEPVSLWQSSYTRLSAHALPVRYKLCQGLNSTLARLEAAENQCFDALLLNDRAQLCETSSASLFWFKNGRLYTPPLDCGILEGATRDAILRLSPWPVSETETMIETLKHAEAVFIANTAWQAVAVNSLLPSGWRWESGKIAGEIRRRLAKDREDYCRARREEW